MTKKEKKIWIAVLVIFLFGLIAAFTEDINSVIEYIGGFSFIVLIASVITYFRNKKKNPAKAKRYWSYFLISLVVLVVSVAGNAMTYNGSKQQKQDIASDFGYC